MHKKLGIVAIMSVITTGCALQETKPEIDAKQKDVMATTSNDLLQVAKDIRSHNKQLSILVQQKLKNENVQQAEDIQSRDMPESLQEDITLRWSGKPEPAVEMIAKSIGYDYVQPEGKAPINPLVVSVNAYTVPAYEVLRDIGLQLGQNAMLVVDVANKKLSISYL